MYEKTYYGRMQTTFSYGEEDLYNFVAEQPINNAKYIKKLIREEMVRRAEGQKNTNVSANESQVSLEQPRQVSLEQPRQVILEQPKQKDEDIDLDNGAVDF